MNSPTLRPKLLVALTLAALLAACGDDAKNAAPKGPAGNAPPPPEVSVLAVGYGDATLTQDLPGRLQAWRTAQVRARIEGIVEKREFTEGSDVRAGQLLYRIDPRTYQTAFDAAKADAAAAKLLVDRYKPLLEIKAVSQQEFDTASARLKQAEAALARTQLDLENTRVPAPIAGRIGRSQVTEGALVGRGEATPLATIEQIDPLYANFTQSGAELAALRDAVNSGRWKEADRARVELVLENGSVYPMPGKLLFSDLAVDPSTGAVSLRAEFPNPKKELLPGMFVRVRFPQATAEKVFRIPQRAVQMSTTGPTVLVVDKEGKVGPRPIKTGGMSGNAWIVTDGLAEGDQVIVEGHMKARPGSTVKPVPWNPQAAAGAKPAATPAAPAEAAQKPAEAPAKPAEAPAADAPKAAPAPTADAAKPQGK